MTTLSRRNLQVLGGLAALALAASACSGGGSTRTTEAAALKHEHEAPKNTASTTSTSTTALSPAHGPTSTTAVAARPGSPTTTSPPLRATSRIPVSAKLSTPCVRPGQKETVTIYAEPHTGVAFDAVYSDGVDGRPGTGYGGNNGGTTDNSGSWHSTWIVSLKAPPGKGVVQVVAGRKTGYGMTKVPFAVAGITGRCS
jgi:hypothetical protein